MGVLLHQQITVPVSRLRAVVGLIAGGGYDQRADLRRGDELGELAADLNHMAERLERGRAEILAQQAEIESFNAELQARVDARTAELRAAQGSLVRASQYAAIAEVGAGLAHELNNPLAAILGLSQVLQARARYDAAGLLRIEEQAQRCRDVVDTMVRFASGDLGPSRAGVVDLQRVVREAVDSQAEAYSQRGVRLEMASWASATPVQARLDPALASQILRRWLEVFRAGLADGAALVVEVAGTGEQPSITFTPDRPLAPESTTHDDWRASGVQVWVARRLVDQSGGRVFEPEGGATAWRILLPAA
jgi:signal transduction histidine kinase